MNVSNKPSYHHGDLRNALLDAADDVLQSAGLQGFTLRACARSAGVSHTAPKHHFGDVAGLLTAVAERGFARLVDSLRDHLAQAKGNLEAEMFATAQAYVSFAEQFPEHFRIMFRSDLVRMDMQAPPCSVAETFTELTNVILRQRGEREITLGESLLDQSSGLVNDVVLGWCYIHGYAHLRLEGQLTMVPEEVHLQQLRLAGDRLSQLIQSQAQPD